ncbi:MAG TPA: serine hydrolase domain-containing protein [Gemmatimonas sp.]|uniref:serine hydrolase domain-containing protein n=1 Tax=Gemmatimonas sp. TaxID=1962908 RepID=UPI002ED96EB9
MPLTDLVHAIHVAAALGASAPDSTLRRLDGSTLSTTRADSLIRSLVAQHHITGLQVAVVNDGRLAWSAAYGLQNKAPDRPLTTNSILWAASITKGVFATYVMHLVEQGRFPLDTPIVTLLGTPLDRVTAYASSAASVVQDPRWARVTPRMLLSHTSGLGNFAYLEPDERMRLHHEPGTAYRYSGEGLNILQYIIEQREGQKLEVLMDDAVFRPLGMTSTAMIHQAPFTERMADRFGREEQFLAATRRSPARAAGSMVSTAEDLSRFAVALMRGTVLKEHTRSEMLRAQIVPQTQHEFPVPGDTGWNAEAKRLGVAYGLGWGLMRTTPHGPAFFKQGHGDGAQTLLLCFMKQRDCLVLMTNSDNGEWAFAPLVEALLGRNALPVEWMSYSPERLRVKN